MWQMRAKLLFAEWLCLVLLAAGVIGWQVYEKDPYLHFHAPDTERYYYTLDNERFQDDGILRQFCYDAVITGTSMTENFRTSDLDGLFGVHSVKATQAGASYRDIAELLGSAFHYTPDLKMVVRGLDLNVLDITGSRVTNRPDYLYDENTWNDVRYLLNRDVLFKRVYSMVKAMKEEGFRPGITDFDDYASWHYSAGINEAAGDIPGILELREAGTPIHLSKEEAERIRQNVEENVIDLAAEHPETEFYLFFTPYSILWWKANVEDGTVYRYLEAEELAAELMLEYKNIHLFSFGCRTDITADLNNYIDSIHYCEWINRLILKWMSKGSYELTRDNFRDRFREELETYTSFDYGRLLDQEDYENDEQALAVLEQELADFSSD